MGKRATLSGGGMVRTHSPPWLPGSGRLSYQAGAPLDLAAVSCRASDQQHGTCQRKSRCAVRQWAAFSLPGGAYFACGRRCACMRFGGWGLMLGAGLDAEERRRRLGRNQSGWWVGCETLCWILGYNKRETGLLGTTFGSLRIIRDAAGPVSPGGKDSFALSLSTRVGRCILPPPPPTPASADPR